MFRILIAKYGKIDILTKKHILDDVIHEATQRIRRKKYGVARGTKQAENGKCSSNGEDTRIRRAATN